MPLWLILLTTFVNVLALIGSLWLGLYIATRNFRSPTAWLAALTLWTMAAWFLHNALQSGLPYQPQKSWLDWIGQGIKFGPALWFHLSVLLRFEVTQPRPLLRLLSWCGVALGYAVALFQIIYSELVPGIYTPGADAGPAVEFANRLTSPSYPLFLALLIILPLLALANLYYTRQHLRSPLLRQQLDHLLLATAVAYLGGLYAGAGAWFRLELWTFPADALLGASIIFLGYSVAKYNALLEGRPMERDARYSIAGISLATLFYVHRSWLLSRIDVGEAAYED